MIIVEEITETNMDCARELTAFPWRWHAFYTHSPLGADGSYPAENYVISYAFRIRKSSSKGFAQRCEVWIKGEDGSPPLVYIVYDGDLFYLQRFSLDYSRQDSQGNPTAEIEFTKDNIIRFLNEQFFEEKSFVFVRQEYIQDPTVYLQGDVENS